PDPIKIILIIDDFEIITENSSFDDNFFSKLRSLVDDGLKIGYFVSSRTPLKDICQQQRIESSKFWGIFDRNIVLGLLINEEKNALVKEPMRLSLTNFKDEAANHKYLVWAGNHPFYIQMVQSVCWNSYEHEFFLDENQLRINIESHINDLWLHRSSEECDVLYLLAAGITRKRDSAVIRRLQRRGIVTKENVFFSPLVNSIMEHYIKHEKNRINSDSLI
ncbi:MAG: hypothetical protein HQL73_10905, partial [Magnetococcales bacterium]|nr:hypothetical protein [Magnetococcales bacterium]